MKSTHVRPASFWHRRRTSRTTEGVEAATLPGGRQASRHYSPITSTSDYPCGDGRCLMSSGLSPKLGQSRLDANDELWNFLSGVREDSASGSLSVVQLD